MKNLILILAIIILSISCTSRSERLAKYKQKTTIVLKVPFKQVLEYDDMNHLLQYYESDTTLVSLIGAMYAVQDSVFVTKYTVFKRSIR